MVRCATTPNAKIVENLVVLMIASGGLPTLRAAHGFVKLRSLSDAMMEALAGVCCTKILETRLCRERDFRGLSTRQREASLQRPNPMTDLER